jgi:hypothetical protein
MKLNKLIQKSLLIQKFIKYYFTIMKRKIYYNKYFQIVQNFIVLLRIIFIFNVDLIIFLLLLIFILNFENN